MGITDLEVLVALVRDHAGPDDKVVVRFNGGTIDAAEDLRHLADAELSHLVVESPQIRVDLGSTSASVRGELELGLHIWQRWAEPRQTWRHSSRKSAALWTFVVATQTALALLCVAAIIYAVSLIGDPTVPAWAIALILLSCFGLLALALWGAVKGVSSTRAVIVPFNADELRKNHLSTKYPRLSLIVAVVAAIVATSGVVAGIATRSP